MAYFSVILMALIGSCLSFFCGFGLGTLLLPAFLLFFPPEIAIAASAVVHMLNNLFKLFLVGRYADRAIVKSFGLLSVLGALGGALCLGWMGNLGSVALYSLGHHSFEITGIKLVIGVLIIAFAFLEIIPRFQAFNLPTKWLPLGGLLSGFFGGLTGQQGALRSAFLIKAGLSKEAFFGTRVVCACLVDLTRITVYFSLLGTALSQIDLSLLLAATFAAFAGAYLGNFWMKKIEMKTINKAVMTALIVFGGLLALGIV